MSLIRTVRDASFHALLRAPAPVLRALAGGPIRRGALELDTQLAVMLRAMQAIGIRDQDDVDRSRRQMDADTDAVAPAPVPMKSVRELTVRGDQGELPARLYVPWTASDCPGLLVYFHGGGWVIGSLNSHDRPLRALAHESRCAVLSVDYRLAPEHKFPAAALDAIAAYAWARAHAAELEVDPNRVGIGGDSAGGNVAAVVTHERKRRGEPQPAVQLLIYPGCDLTRSMPSHRELASGFMLTSTRMDWFIGHYLRSREDERDVLGSPLANDDFSGLAPAIVVTAGFDPLRDEGEAYARKLEDAGVNVDYTCEASLIHGFFNMSGAIDAAEDACVRMARKLAARLA